MTSGERDILISRVVDGVASSSDWVELDMVGAGDPGVWRELAQAQRDKQLLDEAVGSEIGVAEAVRLPAARMGSRRIVIPSWAGWAVAALVVLAVVISPRNNGGNQNVAGTGLIPTFTPASEQTPDAALSSYLDKGRESGRVIRQLPDFVVLEAKPAADGPGYDVVYLRQIVERARVETMNRYQVDEAGRRIPLPSRVISARPAL
jgi:hypothetical protein